MKPVAKYNTCKGVSTVLTVGTPIITLLCCGDMFVHKSSTAISAAGMFGILIAALFLKDKIAENFDNYMNSKNTWFSNKYPENKKCREQPRYDLMSEFRSGI